MPVLGWPRMHSRSLAEARRIDVHVATGRGALAELREELVDELARCLAG